VRIKVSNTARNDLKDIYRYGKPLWGVPNAQKFVRKIRSQCDVLLEHPMLGSEMAELGSNIRMFIIDRHRIVYRINNRMIEIIRIIHPKADKFDIVS
jgi:toxin ParE1/3/4